MQSTYGAPVAFVDFQVSRALPVLNIIFLQLIDLFLLGIEIHESDSILWLFPLITCRLSALPTLYHPYGVVFLWIFISMTIHKTYCFLDIPGNCFIGANNIWKSPFGLLKLLHVQAIKSFTQQGFKTTLNFIQIEKVSGSSIVILCEMCTCNVCRILPAQLEL